MFQGFERIGFLAEINATAVFVEDSLGRRVRLEMDNTFRARNCQGMIICWAVEAFGGRFAWNGGQLGAWGLGMSSGGTKDRLDVTMWF